MTYVHAFLLAAIGGVIAISRFARAKWIPVLIAAGFLSLQLFALGVSIDARARRVLVTEVEAGRGVQHVSEISRALKHEQMPARLTAILAGIGLFVTVVCWAAPHRVSLMVSTKRESTAKIAES